MPRIATTLQEDRQEAFAEEVFAGDGAAVRRLRLQVSRIAPHFRTTLLIGERGVGKRTVARELHRLSPAGCGAFIAMSAEDAAEGAEIPEGCGTVYLEGFAAVGLDLQSELRGWLKTIDRRMRLVLGSEADLRGMLAAGRMRQDLFDTVVMPEIRVAPLRERMGNFDGLAAAMLRRSGHGASFAPDALTALRGYGWPGNLAELWRVCVGLGACGGVVQAEDLRGLGEKPGGEPVRLDEVIERHVKDVLQRCGGNKLRTAELLGISRSTLYRMLDAA